MDFASIADLVLACDGGNPITHVLERRKCLIIAVAGIVRKLEG